MLWELMKQTNATIYCLIRAESDESAWRRLEQKMLEAHYSISQEERNRIVPVMGDLAKPKLGIPPSQYDLLAGTNGCNSINV